MPEQQKISSCLWFDGNAEEAAGFYVSLFNDSGIRRIERFGGGKAVTVEFALGGTITVTLNGGSQFRFAPAISFFVMCEPH